MAKCKTCGAPVTLAPDGDPKHRPALTTPQAAARRLLPMFLDGAFEHAGDDRAQEVLEAGGDVPDIIENWLRGVAGENEPTDPAT